MQRAANQRRQALGLFPDGRMFRVYARVVAALQIRQPANGRSVQALDRTLRCVPRPSHPRQFGGGDGKLILLTTGRPRASCRVNAQLCACRSAVPVRTRPHTPLNRCDGSLRTIHWEFPHQSALYRRYRHALRHSYDPGIVWAKGREDDNDLHACASRGRERRSQPAGQIASNHYGLERYGRSGQPNTPTGHA
jgi:hypothetical protein